MGEIRSRLQGTLSSFFKILTIRLKDSSGFLHIRNYGDTAFAPVVSKSVQGMSFVPSIASLAYTIPDDHQAIFAESLTVSTGGSVTIGSNAAVYVLEDN